MGPRFISLQLLFAGLVLGSCSSEGNVTSGLSDAGPDVSIDARVDGGSDGSAGNASGGSGNVGTGGGLTGGAAGASTGGAGALGGMAGSVAGGMAGTAAGGVAGSSAGGASAGAAGVGGAGGAGCPASCDDRIRCTLDACVNDACAHTIDSAICGSRRYCDLTRGCVDYPACTTTSQCQELWQGDSCKVGILCDVTSSTCSFQLPDQDLDGHAPTSCGGDDCDDASRARFPGNAELCDRIDNDCNGLVDDGASCGGTARCISGACLCPMDGVYCNGSCVDVLTDPYNCGACNNSCSLSEVCHEGACCRVEAICNGVCVDLMTDEQNCGSCGNVCSSGICSVGNCGSTGSCNSAFCPSSGSGVPCCVTPNGPCGTDYGMGCTQNLTDAG